MNTMAILIHSSSARKLARKQEFWPDGVVQTVASAGRLTPRDVTAHLIRQFPSGTQVTSGPVPRCDFRADGTQALSTAERLLHAIRLSVSVLFIQLLPP